MRDQDRTSLALAAMHALMAELAEARTPDPARVAAAAQTLREAKSNLMHPASIARLEARVREARNTPRASRETIQAIEARLVTAQAAWKATAKATHVPSDYRPNTANKKPTAGTWDSDRKANLRAARLTKAQGRQERGATAQATSRTPPPAPAIEADLEAKRASQKAEPPRVITPRKGGARRKAGLKVTPNTAEQATERTAALEARAKAAQASSPAKSANVEATNAARVAEIMALIGRMASPDPARITQALRTERPAVRRAVIKHLQRKQAA